MRWSEEVDLLQEEICQVVDTGIASRMACRVDRTCSTEGES